MKLKTTFYLLIISLLNSGLSGQSDSAYSLNDVDTLRFLDGNVWIGKINNYIEEDEAYLYTRFILRKKGNFLRDRLINKSELFSIVNKGTTMVYQPEESEKYKTYAPQEMNYFVYGREDARAHFNPWVSNLGAGLFSYTGGLVAGNNILTFTVPMVSVGVFDLIPPRKPKNTYRTVAESYLDPYYMGYKKQSKSKRRLGNIISSVVGWGLGVLTHRLFIAETPGG